MSAKQEIINIIDVLPSQIIDELRNYASYLKQRADKEARNSAYLDKIQRGIDQCAAGRGIERDVIEVSEYD